jgi:hypothetical protein
MIRHNGRGVKELNEQTRKTTVCQEGFGLFLLFFSLFLGNGTPDPDSSVRK